MEKTAKYVRNLHYGTGEMKRIIAIVVAVAFLLVAQPIGAD